MPQAPTPANEPARLAALRSSGLLDAKGDALQDIVELAAYACDCPIAYAALVDADRVAVLCSIGLDVRELERDGGFCAHTILGHELFAVSDASADPRFARQPLVAAEPGVRFYAGVPLVTAEGFAFGAIAVMDHKPRELAPSEHLALRVLGRAAMSQLEVLRMEAERQRAQREGDSASDWNALPVGAAVVDRRGRIVRPNQSLLAMLGMTATELENRELASFVGREVAITVLGPQALPDGGVAARMMRKGDEPLDVVVDRRPGDQAPLVVTFAIHGAARVEREAAQAAIAARTDELRRAYELVSRERATREVIERALEASQVIAWHRDLVTGVMAFHGASSSLFGVDPGSVPRSFEEIYALVTPEDLAALNEELQRARRDRDGFHARVRLTGRDGVARWLEARGAYTFDDAGTPIRSTGLVSDVTSAQRAEQEMRVLNHRIQNILESVTDGFVALDREWRYTYVNRRAAEMFGREPSQLVGKHIWTEFPEGVGQPFQLAYERAMAEQVPISLEDHYEPWDRWFENRIYPSAEGLTIFFTEITERKHAEEELRRWRDRLRALSGRLQFVREQESARLAREIHDDMGQTLTALRLELAWVLRRLGNAPADPEARSRFDATTTARLEDMRSLIDSAIGAVRRISAELRPPILDELGLATALRWYADELAKRSQIELYFRDTTSDVRTSREIATALFRIFQESLTNIVRHSGAKRVDAALELRDGEIVMTIQDDGQGFDPGAISDPRSIGLLGMQERAAAVSGTIVFGVRPEGGTRIVVSAPTVETSPPS